MSQPLRVLLVEDSAQDALLILHALGTGGFQPEHQRVDTPEAMTTALDGGAWDIVVSDYTMPAFSGLEALALLHKSGLDVPLIVVTGAIGDEDAVRCLHAGAADYLLKQSLHRLPTAVRRALDSAGERRRLRQAEAELRASEQRHRAIMNSAMDAIVTMDVTGKIVEFSSAAERIFGYAQSEAVGRIMADLIIPPALREQHRRGLARYLAGGPPAVLGRAIEITALRRDGTEFPVELRIQRIDLAGVPFFTGFIRDITERRRVEKMLAWEKCALELIASTAPLSEVLDALVRGLEQQAPGSLCSILLLDADGLHLRHGAAPSLPEGYVRAIDGITIGPAVGSCGTAAHDNRQVIVADIARDPLWADYAEVALKHGLRACWSTPIHSGDGKTIATFAIYHREPQHPVSADLELIERAKHIVSLAIERKQAEGAVQTSRRMLQAVLDNIPQGVFWKDRESRYLGCNAVIVRHRGVENAEALKGKSDRDFGSLTPEQAEHFIRKDREIMASGKPELGIIEQTTRSDGSTRWLETNKVPLFDSTGNVIGVLGTWQDITARKQAEEALQMMRFSVDRAGDSVAWIGREGHILYVNDAMCAGRGYSREELLGMRIFDLDPDYQPGVWESHFEELKRCGTITLHTRHRTKEGRIFPVEVNANYVFINGQEFNFATMRDLTDRQKQERFAQRSQRLEAIGTLAGGVAHDLNNALAPIMMGLQLLKIEYPTESKIVDMFETSAQRGADMVRHLLTFAKGAEGERVSIHLRRLVQELVALMKGSFPKNIRLEIKCDPNLPNVLGDATQLHQVLLNLCVNARDAMPQGGTLTLAVECMDVDADYASSIHSAKPGRYLAMRVADTGTGIPPEIIDRIFDPFFTTKEPDKGTGLGLSTCMGIVTGHGGFLHVHSQPGHGSTFTAFLPVDLAGSHSEPVTRTPGEFRGRGETILFVDDDTAVRELGRAVLRHLNFKPVTATDGADGLIQAAQNRTEIRAIITDLHMPRMDGLAFVREVRQMLPDIPIVVASGRMDDDLSEAFKALGVTDRLDKPFTQAQLTEALKHLLAPN